MRIREECRKIPYITIILLFTGIPSASYTENDTCGITWQIQNRIIGGSQAEVGSWPWMAVLLVRREDGALSLRCGASLVTHLHVVTAAHCVVYAKTETAFSPMILVVRLGAHDISKPSEPGSIDVDVEEVRTHERYSIKPVKNDIAVLKLKGWVTFTANIFPVCLPFNSLVEEDISQRQAIVTGHGKTDFSDYATSDVLLQAVVFIESQESCIKAYEGIPIDDTHLCAGTPDGSRDSCTYDSGGPLVISENGKYYLIGIVSFGNECGLPTHPGVYTRVTTFLDWLAINLFF